MYFSGWTFVLRKYPGQNMDTFNPLQLGNTSTSAIWAIVGVLNDLEMFMTFFHEIIVKS